MKTFSLLTVGLLSTAVAADPNAHHKHRKHNGSECFQLLHSEHVVQTSANTTLMAQMQANHPKMAAKIKKDLPKAQSRVTAITGNSSHPADWLANCHAMGAHLHTKHQCKEKEFLPKMLAKWNDATTGPQEMKKLKWTDAQFTQEKGKLDAKIKALNANSTLTDLCVSMPKDKKGDKNGKDGKDGKDGKADGKDGKPGKGPDGKAAGKLLIEDMEDKLIISSEAEERSQRPQWRRGRPRGYLCPRGYACHGGHHSVRWSMSTTTMI
jgi:hypothetical protein